MATTVGSLGNSGTINVNTNQDLQVGASITNNSGAFFTLQSDAGLQGVGGITNSGTFQKSGTGGTSDITMNFTNANQLSVITGTLELSGPALQSAGDTFIATGATLKIPAGQVYSVVGGFVTNSGSSTLNGDLDLTGTGTFEPGGSNGSGNFTVTRSLNFLSGGGVLIIPINFNANSYGTLTVGFILNFNGGSGTLVADVVNNPPLPGSVYHIITYGIINGDFATKRLSYFGGHFTTTPAPSPYTLTAVNGNGPASADALDLSGNSASPSDTASSESLPGPSPVWTRTPSTLVHALDLGIFVPRSFLPDSTPQAGNDPLGAWPALNPQTVDALFAQPTNKHPLEIGAMALLAHQEPPPLDKRLALFPIPNSSEL